MKGSKVEVKFLRVLNRVSIRKGHANETLSRISPSFCRESRFSDTFVECIVLLSIPARTTQLSMSFRMLLLGFNYFSSAD